MFCEEWTSVTKSSALFSSSKERTCLRGCLYSDVSRGAVKSDVVVEQVWRIDNQEVRRIDFDASDKLHDERWYSVGECPCCAAAFV